MPANQHTLLGAISHANRKHKVGRGGREKGFNYQDCPQRSIHVVRGASYTAGTTIVYLCSIAS